MASWIWYPGEYEIFHNNQMNTRREELNIKEYIVFWQVPALYPRVNFFKDFKAERESEITVFSHSAGFFYLDGKQYPLRTSVHIAAGNHSMEIRLLEINGHLPCIFIDSPFLKTDSSWLVGNGSSKRVPVGTLPYYGTPESDPEVFPFLYKKIDFVKKTEVTHGINYDFGKETYGPVVLKGIPENSEITVCYGESLEESLDPENAVISQKISGKENCRLKSRAFRYITLFGEQADKIRLQAEYEYLPLDDVGNFSCEDEEIGKVYDVCAYTFHLNSREFYIDGIKRDHWVWSGDAYQSFMINNYLYFDPEITKRTILALLGKPPYEQHINTINDYSMYLIISVYDYYFSTGDKAFVRSVYDKIVELYRFCESRLDENGFVVERDGDWIFIDWSDIDKEGPVCAEQILLWQANRAMAKLSELCEADSRPYIKAAAELKEKIVRYYWNEDKKAFIDSFESGRNKVTRHANIFAILYDFIDIETQRVLLKSVLQNDGITQITTPYFKFFELCALCKLGELEEMQKLLKSYWGGMLRLGATSVWEQYNPDEHGAEHYAMYNMKYGKSLCHAWGSGPIYLLGRYCLGVYPTAPGYETFAVEPNAGIYHSMRGSVPLPEGNKAEVLYENGVLSVTATRGGGVLLAGGKEIPLPAGETVTVNCRFEKE